MPRFYNRVRATVTAGGTGAITVSTGSTGYRSFADAGVPNLAGVRYLIEDGSAWEIGFGIYTTTGTTLTRYLDESSTGSALNVSTSATVSVIAAVPEGIDPMRASIFRPSPGSTNTNQAWGFNPAGTATGRTPANTSMFTALTRVGFVTSTTAGTVAGIRNQGVPYWRGSAAGLGGFHLSMRFGISQYLAGSRIFCGLDDTGSQQTLTADPSAASGGNTNCFAMIKDAADTEFSIYHCDSALSGTKIALGANFPADTSNTDIYEFTLWAAPNGSDIKWRVWRVNTGHVTQGTATTELMANNLMLGYHLAVNNVSAAATAIDCFGFVGHYGD